LDLAGLREEDKTLREQRIVTAAEHLFLKNGYVDTRIEDIAAEAEVSVGTIYNYFQNKTDMLLRIVAHRGWGDCPGTFGAFRLPARRSD